ncbi:hypothetical protein BJ508DRAFT_363469 [Ascobolus immersus RN42]|uniref:LysM domain-containing protein n=1 Tax=Ascobolus immersus RN42 TaxID=1160509 RepID=A0A3N4I0S0_ASCIM|nr:hypothetical protein BJ508DRAFT_363469 [Ascobolus immersus RN42]
MVRTLSNIPPELHLIISTSLSLSPLDLLSLSKTSRRLHNIYHPLFHAAIHTIITTTHDPAGWTRRLCFAPLPVLHHLFTKWNWKPATITDPKLDFLQLHQNYLDALYTDDVEPYALTGTGWMTSQNPEEVHRLDREMLAYVAGRTEKTKALLRDEETTSILNRLWIEQSDTFFMRVLVDVFEWDPFKYDMVEDKRFLTLVDDVTMRTNTLVRRQFLTLGIDPAKLVSGDEDQKVLYHAILRLVTEHAVERGGYSLGGDNGCGLSEEQEAAVASVVGIFKAVIARGRKLGELGHYVDSAILVTGFEKGELWPAGFVAVHLPGLLWDGLRSAPTNRSLGLSSTLEPKTMTEAEKENLRNAFIELMGAVCGRLGLEESVSIDWDAPLAVSCRVLGLDVDVDELVPVPKTMARLALRWLEGTKEGEDRSALLTRVKLAVGQLISCAGGEPVVPQQPPVARKTVTATDMIIETTYSSIWLPATTLITVPKPPEPSASPSPSPSKGATKTSPTISAKTEVSTPRPTKDNPFVVKPIVAPSTSTPTPKPKPTGIQPKPTPKPGPEPPEPESSSKANQLVIVDFLPLNAIKQPQAAASCNQWVFAEWGLTCNEIERQLGIKATDVIRWNDVGVDCRRMWAGTHVCVGVMKDDDGTNSGASTSTGSATMTSDVDSDPPIASPTSSWFPTLPTGSPITVRPKPKPKPSSTKTRYSDIIETVTLPTTSSSSSSTKPVKPSSTKTKYTVTTETVTLPTTSSSLSSNSTKPVTKTEHIDLVETVTVSTTSPSLTESYGMTAPVEPTGTTFSTVTPSTTSSLTETYDWTVPTVSISTEESTTSSTFSTSSAFVTSISTGTTGPSAGTTTSEMALPPPASTSSEESTTSTGVSVSETSTTSTGASVTKTPTSTTSKSSTTTARPTSTTSSSTSEVPPTTSELPTTTTPPPAPSPTPGLIIFTSTAGTITTSVFNGSNGYTPGTLTAIDTITETGYPDPTTTSSSIPAVPTTSISATPTAPSQPQAETQTLTHGPLIQTIPDGMGGFITDTMFVTETATYTEFPAVKSEKPDLPIGPSTTTQATSTISVPEQPVFSPNSTLTYTTSSSSVRASTGTKTTRTASTATDSDWEWGGWWNGTTPHNGTSTSEYGAPRPITRGPSSTTKTVKSVTATTDDILTATDVEVGTPVTPEPTADSSVEPAPALATSTATSSSRSTSTRESSLPESTELPASSTLTETSGISIASETAPGTSSSTSRETTSTVASTQTDMNSTGTFSTPVSSPETATETSSSTVTESTSKAASTLTETGISSPSSASTSSTKSTASSSATDETSTVASTSTETSSTSTSSPSVSVTESAVETSSSISTDTTSTAANKPGMILPPSTSSEPSSGTTSSTSQSKSSTAMSEASTKTSQTSSSSSQYTSSTSSSSSTSTSEATSSSSSSAVPSNTSAPSLETEDSLNSERDKKAAPVNKGYKVDGFVAMPNSTESEKGSEEKKQENGEAEKKGKERNRNALTAGAAIAPSEPTGNATLAGKVAP